MQPVKMLLGALAIALATCPLCFNSADAKKPDKPPGGGGGDETTPFSVIELPDVKVAFAVSNADAGGLVTVVGRNEGDAAYALVDVDTRQVIASGLLPGPSGVNSTARDANVAGEIVGNAGSDPVRWIPQGTAYVFELLPLLAGDSNSSVVAVNEAGEMVGTSNTLGSNRAAYWSADGTTVVDLNTFVPAASGWTLTAASDINTFGQVVGYGVLNGVDRGFILDLVTGAIDAVPLVVGAVENEAWQINEAGHVIGKANDDVVGGEPFPQGGWGFFWGGPGTQPQLLPTAIVGRGIARGINNLDELVGDSEDPGGQLYQDDLFMSLWEPDGVGGLLVTDPGTQIPTKPVWYLRGGFGINDDLWIAGEGRKRVKGKYSWHGVLVVPNL